MAISRSPTRSSTAPTNPTTTGFVTREQEVFLNAIRNDVDLSDHMEDAVNSLRIVLAADESFRTGKMVDL